MAGKGSIFLTFQNKADAMNIEPLKKRLERQGYVLNGYVLNGHKAVVIGGPYATHFIVTVRDPYDHVLVHHTPAAVNITLKVRVSVNKTCHSDPYQHAL